MSEVGTSVLRTLNTATVLDALRQAQRPLRIAELASLSRLTRPTVATAVEELKAAGLVVDSPPTTSERPRRGRPASMFQLASAARPVLGIEVGRGTVRVLVMDLAGAVLGQSHRDIPDPQDAVALVDQLPLAVQHAVAAAGLHTGDLHRVVVGAPGVVDPAAGHPVTHPGVTGWSQLDVPQRVREMFDCPTIFESEANLAAVAAATTRPSSTVLAIHWAGHVSAGMVIAGRLHRGATGSAGGFWDTPFDRSDRMPPADAFALAAEGDHAAMGAVRSMARQVVGSITPLVLAIDPDVVVVGGAAAGAGELALQPIRDELSLRTPRAPEVVASEWGEDLVVRGAAELARAEVWATAMESLGRTPATAR